MRRRFLHYKCSVYLRWGNKVKTTNNSLMEIYLSLIHINSPQVFRLFQTGALTWPFGLSRKHIKLCSKILCLFWGTNTLMRHRMLCLLKLQPREKEEICFLFCFAQCLISSCLIIQINQTECLLHEWRYTEKESCSHAQVFLSKVDLNN